MGDAKFYAFFLRVLTPITPEPTGLMMMMMMMMTVDDELMWL